MRRAAAVAVVTVVFALGGGACASPKLDADGARGFSVEALRASGLGEVATVEDATVAPCTVEGAEGWRTVTATDAGEVSMCVSRDQGRALSVRDPGMTDAQFARLEAYRGETSADRAIPLATASAVLLLVGTVLGLILELRPRGPAS